MAGENLLGENCSLLTSSLWLAPSVFSGLLLLQPAPLKEFSASVFK